MAFIDPSSKQINCKVVYFGPVHAGKSTTLRGIYKELGKGSGKIKSLNRSQDETLFFDFLPLSLGTISGQKVRVHLYSIPSPILYNASRRLILKGIDGVVFVADSQVGRLEENMTCLRDLDDNLRDQDIFFEELPLVFQYNKRDLGKTIAPLSTLNTALNPEERPWFESIASKQQGILEPLQEVTKRVLQELRFEA